MNYQEENESKQFHRNEKGGIKSSGSVIDTKGHGGNYSKLDV